MNKINDDDDDDEIINKNVLIGLKIM